MPLDIVVTNAGRAALINADNTGTTPVAITAIGLSSAAVAPHPSLTVLAGEFKRMGAVSGEVVADDTIHLSVMDTSADSYTLRSVGLYLADGTLFAIYGQTGPILEKTASSDAALSLDVIFADISAALLTFGDATFVNPPATTERQGVVELATLAEARAGIDALRALTSAGANAAILGWLLAQDGAGSGLDADLLDGQQGAWYADIAARLGFTPVNKAGDTMTGPLALPGNPTANGHAANKQYVDDLTTAAALLAKLLLVDGAGSGSDADLLDGLHAASFARVDHASGAAFIGPVSAFEFATTGQVKAVSGMTVGAGSSPYIYAEGNRYNVRVGVPGNYSYLRVGANSLTLNDAEVVRLLGEVSGDGAGHRMYTDGYKECWGITSFPANQSKVVPFPFAFMQWSHCYLEGGIENALQAENTPYVKDSATLNFTAFNSANDVVWCRWRAFGR